jgi:hypothetical protein
LEPIEAAHEAARVLVASSAWPPSPRYALKFPTWSEPSSDKYCQAFQYTELTKDDDFFIDIQEIRLPFQIYGRGQTVIFSSCQPLVFRTGQWKKPMAGVVTASGEGRVEWRTSILLQGGKAVVLDAEEG